MYKQGCQCCIAEDEQDINDGDSEYKTMGIRKGPVKGTVKQWDLWQGIVNDGACDRAQ